MLAQKDLEAAVRASVPSKGMSHPWLRFLWRPWKGIWLSMPSSIRYTVYCGLFWIGEKIYGIPGSSVQSLPFGLFCKFGLRELRTSEALTMMFVAANTTIPVPTVLDIVDYSSGVFILMTRVPGRNVRESLYYSEISSSDFENTLRDWYSQLRFLPPPGDGAVCTIDGGSFRCFRSGFTDPIGPFPDIASFHRILSKRTTCRSMEELNELREFARRTHEKPHRLCFSYGDIHLNNLLIHNGQLSGLVDWECAGWFPEYWDYTVAVYRHCTAVEWAMPLRNIFPQYDEELEVEKRFWRVLDSF